MAGDVVVALPRELSRQKALGLARLVLSGREYAELARQIRPSRPPNRSRSALRRQSGAVVSMLLIVVHIGLVNLCPTVRESVPSRS